MTLEGYSQVNVFPLFLGYWYLKPGLFAALLCLQKQLILKKYFNNSNASFTKVDLMQVASL